jgi:hypothetical protein
MLLINPYSESAASSEQLQKYDPNMIDAKVMTDANRAYQIIYEDLLQKMPTEEKAMIKDSFVGVYCKIRQAHLQYHTLVQNQNVQSYAIVEDPKNGQRMYGVPHEYDQNAHQNDRQNNLKLNAQTDFTPVNYEKEARFQICAQYSLYKPEKYEQYLHEKQRSDEGSDPSMQEGYSKGKKFRNRKRQNEKGFYMKDKKMDNHDETEFVLTTRQKRLQMFAEKQSYPHHRKDDNKIYSKSSGDKFQGKYKREGKRSSQEKRRVRSITSSSNSRSRS